MLKKIIHSFDEKVGHYLNRDNTIPLFVFLLIGILTVDAVISNIADFVPDQLRSAYGFVLFFTIICLSSVGQYLILNHVKNLLNSILVRTSRLTWIRNAMFIVQIILISVIFLVFAQIIITDAYYTFVLLLNTSISYITAIVLLSILSIRFFLWVRERKSVIIVLYTLASLGLVVMSICALVLMDYLIALRPPVITSTTPTIYPTFEDGSIESSLSDLYAYADIVSFVLIWTGTALILHHHSKQLGAIKYWAVVSLPLIYFFSSFFDRIPGLEFFDDSSFIILTTLNSSAGGVLFGVVFWIASKSIRQKNIVREYLKILAYGFIIWFTCNQASLIAAPYPPFGIAAVSTMGVAAYLIFIGLFCSAISLSQDNMVRRAILKSTANELKMLGEIGFSEMSSDIGRKIAQVEKKNLEALEDDSGVSSSLTSEDIEVYIDEVLRELKKK